MKKILFHLLFVCSYPLMSQTNLVPNGGFEEYASCPSNSPGNASVYLAEPWIGYSSDFMHTCAGFDPFYIDENSYSTPRNGEGHIRGVSYSSANYDTREYAEVQLTEALEIGELYCVEYFCKLQAPINVGLVGVDGMGAFFTEDFAEWEDIINADWPTGEPAPIVTIIAEAQVISEAIHYDTLNYTSVSGSFTADKAYNYVTIGNFINDNKLNFHTVVGAPPMTIDFTSYAIDDVAVWKCNDVSLEEQTTLPQLYPITNGFVLKRINEPLVVSVYDMSGRKVHQQSFQNEARCDLSFLPAGLYVYHVNSNTGIFESGKLFCD